jgi:hypothetical protein
VAPVAKPKSDEDEPKVDLLGQLSVDLGVEYLLRPSRQAISNIERQTGLSLPQLAIQCGSLALSVENLGICVAEMMQAYAGFDPTANADYRGAKANNCADLVYENGPVDVSRRLAVIFTGALAGGYTASGEPKAVGTTTEPTPTAD